MGRARIRHRRAAVVVLAVVAALVSWTGAAQAAGVVWQSDFTNANFNNFKSTPWNNVPASAVPAIVASKAYPAPAKAAEFSVPVGGTRSEIEPNVTNFTEGADYYFRDTFTLPRDFPVNADSWQVISQWKNADTGSPPVELKIGNGSVFLDGGYGYPTGTAGSKYWTTQSLAPAVTTTPQTVVVHIHFSANPSLGSIDAWVNGTSVLAGYHPISGTLYPGGKKTKASATQAKAQKAALAKTPQPKNAPKEPAASTDTVVTATATAQYDYWKMGMYRDNTLPSGATYDVENTKMGTSYTDVTG